MIGILFALRYNSAVKQTQHGGSGSGSAATAKAENIRDEMEEASTRVDQAKVICTLVITVQTNFYKLISIKGCN